MQTNPAKELRLTQFVASLTKIDTNPAPPATHHVCSPGNPLGGLVTHLNTH
jgi:hypothetical protein